MGLYNFQPFVGGAISLGIIVLHLFLLNMMVQCYSQRSQSFLNLGSLLDISCNFDSVVSGIKNSHFFANITAIIRGNLTNSEIKGIVLPV